MRRREQACEVHASGAAQGAGATSRGRGGQQTKLFSFFLVAVHFGQFVLTEKLK